MEVIKCMKCRKLKMEVEICGLNSREIKSLAKSIKNLGGL